jgi:hypothetical protein
MYDSDLITKLLTRVEQLSREAGRQETMISQLQNEIAQLATENDNYALLVAELKENPAIRVDVPSPDIF